MTGVNLPAGWFVELTGKVNGPAWDNRQSDVELPKSPDTLVDAHYGRLRRLCRLLLGDLEEAEDVVQDVFLKAHEAARFGQPPMDWGAWLTRVAVNACHDRRRAGGWMRFRFWSTPVEDTTLAAEMLGPGDAALGTETRRRIWEAFRALPRRQHQVFALRYVEEQSTQEVATALGLNAGSVKRHISRAIRQLRRALREPA